jgi:ABC-2 type transport system ATP-binding protein
VDHVSFGAPRGEIFGFLGPNGAGKTTTIRVLTTLLRPTSGEAVVNGFDVEEEPEAVRRSLGYVTQEVTVEDLLTGRENLLFYSKLHDVPRRDRERRIIDALELVGLTERAGDMVRNYSGGMKRRLEVAGALVHHPAILFLDEPSLGLDPQTRSHLWEYFERLRRERGTTIFLTTHHMEEANHLSDRVCIIDRGQIVALGTPEELKASVGGDILTIHTADGLAETPAALTALPGVKAVATANGEVKVTAVRGEEVLPTVLDLLREQRIGVRSVHLEQPTLEDVFLKYTGRRLREEEPGRPSGLRRIRTAMRARR